MKEMEKRLETVEEGTKKMADNLGKLQQRVEKIRKKQGKMGEKMDKKMDKKINQSENRTFELAAKPCCRGGIAARVTCFALPLRGRCSKTVSVYSPPSSLP
jgi:hypothetical protein